MKSKQLIRTTLYLAATLIFTVGALADVIHIPADYPVIQEGINAAVNGDTVLIADGIYQNAGNTNLSFSGKSITVISENGPDACIIDCNGQNRGVQFTTGETENAILEGLTIREGSGNKGGGIYIAGASPVIRNCTIRQNAARLEGGGIYCDGGSPRITGCRILNNRTDDETSGAGAGIKLEGGSMIIENCLVSANHIDSDMYGDGGGISMSSGTIAVLTNCVVKGNSSGDYMAGGGGGLFVMGNAQIINCLFYQNTCTLQGSAIYCYGSNVSIRNSTIWDNEATGCDSGGIHAGDSILSMEDCIVWGNETDGVSNYLSTVSIDYCNIQESHPGTGNISENPEFATGPDGPCYLRNIAAGQPVDSPCIDAGSGQSADICFEMDGLNICMDVMTTRTDSGSDTGVVDMGFHYMNGTSLPTPTPTPTPTSTPTSTPTPDPGEPTPTPTPDDWYGVQLSINGETFTSGDAFKLRTHCQAPPEITEADLYVILDVNGSYFFWPTWTPEYDRETVELNYDRTDYFFVLDFKWPSDFSNRADGLRFWSGITDPATGSIIGNISMVEFGYY